MSAPCNSLHNNGAARWRGLALAALLGTCVHACALSKPATQTPVAEAVPETPAIPAVAQQQFDEAMRQAQAGQTEQAMLTLQELAVSYPALSSPLINLGLLEQKAGRHESALDYFQRALERNASSAAAHAGMGLSYRQLGRFQDAEQAYQAAIDVDASYAPAHLNLGILHDLYLQNPPKALQEYETYQSLLSEPDAKVAVWIRDLKVRVNSAAKLNSSAATTGAQP